MYLHENNLLFQQQFEFREDHSTSHALVDLISSICDSFYQNKFAVDVLIDLSKAFGTVGHIILPNKLSLYGVKKQ